MVNVGFRELGPDNLFRCGDGEPGPGIVVMCDIRRGRPAEQRLRLAEGIRQICSNELGFGPNQVVIQFTQHAADEMYRDGGWGRVGGAAVGGSRCGAPTAAPLSGLRPA